MFKIPEYFLPKIAFLQFILIIFLHYLININLKIVRPIYFRFLPSRNIKLDPSTSVLSHLEI